MVNNFDRSHKGMGSKGNALHNLIAQLFPVLNDDIYVGLVLC
jgi:hypothetical protein